MGKDLYAAEAKASDASGGQTIPFASQDTFLDSLKLPSLSLRLGSSRPIVLPLDLATASKNLSPAPSSCLL